MFNNFPNGYIEEELLGQGAEAKVIKYLTPEGKYIAVKKYHKQQILGDDIIRCIKSFCGSDEISIKNPSYDNEWEIVRKFDDNSPLLKYHCIKEIDGQQYLLMEYFPSITLSSYFNTYFTYQRDITPEINKIISGLSQCLSYLCKNNIYHGDLTKNRNILVNPYTGRVVIIDFGYSCYKKNEDILQILIYLLESEIQSLIGKGYLIYHNNKVITKDDVHTYLSEEYTILI